MTRPSAVFIASERFRGHSYGGNHPLNIPRVPLTRDLINAYRPMGPDDYLEAREATAEELGWFHDGAYIEALRQCQERGRVSSQHRQKFNLGNFENPFFENIFSIPALAAGGSIQGAEQVIAGRMAFNPAGGMHHGMPGRARGFCYINDVALGIMRLRRQGYRVLYFDMDAHHGDGVQFAFDCDPDTLTVSFHMDTAYAYPRRGGGIDDRGRTETAINLPLPEELNDSEYRLAFNTLWPRILSVFTPDAVVLQTGTDILHHDPLSKLRCSNRLFLEIVERIIDDAPRDCGGRPRLLVLGGGGYHPAALARCWTGVWSNLASWNLPDELPQVGRRLLQGVGRQDEQGPSGKAALYIKRLDPPAEGSVRDAIRHRVDHLVAGHPFFNGIA